MIIKKNTSIKFYLSGDLVIPEETDVNYIELVDHAVNFIKTSENVRSNIVMFDENKTLLINSQEALESFIESQNQS